MSAVELQNLKIQVATLRNELRQRPIITSRTPPATVVQNKTLVVIGGNAAQIGNSLEGIQYASAPPTLTQAYDPDVDTVYPAGLGRGYLYINGEPQANRVLIRHDFAPYPPPVLVGTLLRPAGTVTLTYDPGGGGAVVTMTAYRFDWL